MHWLLTALSGIQRLLPFQRTHLAGQVQSLSCPRERTPPEWCCDASSGTAACGSCGTGRRLAAGPAFTVQVPEHAALIQLDAGPAPRGEGWVEAVNSPMFETEVDRVRESIRRDRPLGDEIWTLANAKDLGLEYSLHPRGRPPKSNRD